MRNGIWEATGYKTFVAGLLFLPDMRPDEAMEQVARDHEHMHIICGLDNLQEDLERIAAREGFKKPPEPWVTENESRRVNELQFRGLAGQPQDGRETKEATPGQARAPALETERQLTVGSATINIQYVGTLVIQHCPQERDPDGKPDTPAS